MLAQADTLWHRLTHFGARPNKEFGHILTPMGFGRLGGEGGVEVNHKNVTPTYWFCSKLFFGTIWTQKVKEKKLRLSLSYHHNS